MCKGMSLQKVAPALDSKALTLITHVNLGDVYLMLNGGDVFIGQCFSWFPHEWHLF